MDDIAARLCEEGLKAGQGYHVIYTTSCVLDEAYCGWRERVARQRGDMLT